MGKSLSTIVIIIVAFCSLLHMPPTNGFPGGRKLIAVPAFALEDAVECAVGNGDGSHNCAFTRTNTELHRTPRSSHLRKPAIRAVLHSAALNGAPKTWAQAATDRRLAPSDRTVLVREEA